MLYIILYIAGVITGFKFKDRIQKLFQNHIGGRIDPEVAKMKQLLRNWLAE